ncbi:MAG: MFS transporter [Chitinophagaceae bacterium]
MLNKLPISKTAAIGILVSALGFFVDIYDMMIFSSIKEKSFVALHLTNENNEWTLYTRDILNFQMIGMLIGGFLWGTIGDKFGRLKVLFGSIFMYSLFTFLNAYVSNVNEYKWCRFFAGIGLAGELGAGITLVTEQIDKKYRGFAVAIVGCIGMLGAVTAGLVNSLSITWKFAYLLGGFMGIMLLVLRLGVIESGMFNTMSKNEQISKGNFFIILKNNNLLKKFACVLLVGLPSWYASGILVTHTTVIAKGMNMQGTLPITAKVLSLNFLGFAVGDILCGLLSQYLKSRKKAIFTFLSLYSFFVILYFSIGKENIVLYYSLFIGMGISIGYSVMLFTLAAEQFGTNLRTLVSSTSLNLVRAWTIPLSYSFTYFATIFNNNYYKSAMVIGIICITIALIALTQLEETFNKNLDYYN